MQVTHSIEADNDFKGVIIPEHILLSDVTMSEMLILSMIYGFSKKDGVVFWGKRKYISSFLRISERTTDRAISSLVKKGYLLKHKSNGKSTLAVADPSKFTERRPCEY